MVNSYQAPSRKDKQHEHSHSQTTETNVVHEAAPVSKVLESKGKDVFTLRPQNSIQEATRMLHEKKVGALVVLDANGAIQGIVSERDVVQKLSGAHGYELGHSVEEIMTRNVITCHPEDTLISVLQRMTEGRFRHMPVVDNHSLIGIISIGDVVNYRLVELEYESLKLKQLIVG